MSEQDAPESQEAPHVDETGVEETGVASVDQVLASMAEVEGRPVEEHVEIFEKAHDGLRRALDGAGSA